MVTAQTHSLINDDARLGLSSDTASSSRMAFHTHNNSYIFVLKSASGNHVTWNSIVPDPNVLCAYMYFILGCLQGAPLAALVGLTKEPQSTAWATLFATEDQPTLYVDLQGIYTLIGAIDQMLKRSRSDHEATPLNLLSGCLSSDHVGRKAELAFAIVWLSTVTRWWARLCKISLQSLHWIWNNRLVHGQSKWAGRMAKSGRPRPERTGREIALPPQRESRVEIPFKPLVCNSCIYGEDRQPLTHSLSLSHTRTHTRAIMLQEALLGFSLLGQTRANIQSWFLSHCRSDSHRVSSNSEFFWTKKKKIIEIYILSS